MLRSLSIRDFILIDELEVEFGSGLNIITGETGAGKSILVGALKMILGDRASTDVVRPGQSKAVVEGVFDLPDDPRLGTLLEQNGIDQMPHLILRREVSSVQSRAFINDSPATVTLLKEVASELVDLHGQHEHQSLLRTETHLDLLDSFGGLESLARSYREQFERVRLVQERRSRILGRERELSRERDLLEFQINEIDEIRPQQGEDDSLEAERRILENAERLYEATLSLFELLYDSESAINDLLVRARNELQDLSRIDDTFASIREEVASAQISVSEAASFLQDYNSRIEFNPDRLEAIRLRMMDLDRLSRKYGGTLDAVLAYRTEIGERFELAADFQGALARIDEELDTEKAALSDIAWRLSAKRAAVAARVEEAIVHELADLGMPDTRFQVRLDRMEEADGWILDEEGKAWNAFRNGVDKGAFFISTNPGVEPMPLARVASGGEISRIMLGLKSVLAKSDRLPILIFDEIDTGISGAVAQRVGDCMLSLAGYHQIVAITHLPQVAAAGQTHFKVEKSSEGGGVRTRMRRLQEGERREEIAALLSGTTVTEASLRSARELLDSRPASGN